MLIQCKRVYFPAEKDDGYRVLVDRLWPRGIKKAALVYDEWNKAITPSTELRKAFHSEVIDFNHFGAAIPGRTRATTTRRQTAGGYCPTPTADVAIRRQRYSPEPCHCAGGVATRTVIVGPPPGLVVCPGTTASNVLRVPRPGRADHRRRLRRPSLATAPEALLSAVW